MNYGSLLSSNDLEDLSQSQQDTINQQHTQSDKKKTHFSFLIIFLFSIILSIVLWTQSYPHALSSIRNQIQFNEGLKSIRASSVIFGVGLDLGNNTLGVESENILEVSNVQPMFETQSNGSSSTGEISFKLTRVGYAPITLDDSLFKYQFLQNYDVIIEPHVSMSLIVVDYTDTSFYYKYKFCVVSNLDDCIFGVLSIDPTVAMGVDVTIPCSPYDEYTLFINQVSAQSGETIQSTVGKALCIYVRREIRSLSTDDLNKALDAMYAVYSVNESIGTELYGDNYHDSLYLLEFHHFNAAWQDADHIHEGNGFLPQHIKMTNLFEKSMQAIDPSVILPYWDFTLDQSEGKTSVSSYIMTPSIFGNMNQPTDLNWGFTKADDNILNAAILDGRWAYLRTDMNTKYPELLAGYGYMRAPWNMNPSPYISRFTMDLQIGTSLPTCSQHYDVLNYDDMMDFFYQISYAPHATAHSLTGGIYGCDLFIPLLEQGYITDETALKTICSSWVFYLKEFYRYNFILPLSNCSVNNVSDAKCGFYCPDPDSTEFKFNLKNKISSNVPSDLSDDGWQAWVDFVCDGDGGNIFSGDHLESASPADPSFWVIHPTLERLLHARFMAGGFTIEDWATDAINDNVCDKSICYESAYGTKDSHEECCYGHYGTDRTLDFVHGNRSNYIFESNQEVVDMTDPRNLNYSMSYIYDSFTWNHCSQDFQGYLEGLYEAYIATHPTPSPTSAPSLGGDAIVPPLTTSFSPTNQLTLSPTSSYSTLSPTQSLNSQTVSPTTDGMDSQFSSPPSFSPSMSITSPPSLSPSLSSSSSSISPTNSPTLMTELAPTQFPTEKAPTQFPSPQIEPSPSPTKALSPTQYPTEQAPTPYPIAG